MTGEEKRRGPGKGRAATENARTDNSTAAPPGAIAADVVLRSDRAGITAEWHGEIHVFGGRDDGSVTIEVRGRGRSVLVYLGAYDAFAVAAELEMAPDACPALSRPEAPAWRRPST